jgi:hypothetical protein
LASQPTTRTLDIPNVPASTVSATVSGPFTFVSMTVWRAS